MEKLISRIEIILNNCKGPDILHVGCLDDLEKINSNKWLHGVLCRKFGNVVGIDINPDVLKLRELGYEVYLANAENFKLDKKFDTIVATGLLQYLSNPGSFLDAAWEHLKEDGILILTIPNTFWIGLWIKKILRQKIPTDRTLWFDLQAILNLISRYNFKIMKIVPLVNTTYESNTIGGKTINLILKLFKFLLPVELKTEGYCIVLTAKSK